MIGNACARGFPTHTFPPSLWPADCRYRLLAFLRGVVADPRIEQLGRRHPCLLQLVEVNAVILRQGIVDDVEGRVPYT